MDLKRSLMVAIVALLVTKFSIFMVVKGASFSNLNDHHHHHQSSSCRFPAIFSFGDSYSDTGAMSAAFVQYTAPYGMTYFRKHSGRSSDGRLIIDFIAEKLGLPYLSAYLDSIGTNYRHGANFAASSATIQPANVPMLNNTFSPFTLDVQLSQFTQFKERSSDLFCKGSEKSCDVEGHFPRLEDYGRALYMFDIGLNDLNGWIQSKNKEQLKTYIPNLINQFASVVEKLYQGGARVFWIQNTSPLGCMPFYVKNYPRAPDDADQIRCVKSYNEIAQDFNKQLKDKISQLRTQLQEALLVYVDIYSVKYSLISEANKHGFIDPLEQCLGKDGKLCANPLKYISWDGIHYTEAANKWVANRIQDGSVSSPMIPLTEVCRAISGSHQ